jgi:hypothetical protein
VLFIAPATKKKGRKRLKVLDPEGKDIPTKDSMYGQHDNFIAFCHTVQIRRSGDNRHVY